MVALNESPSKTFWFRMMYPEHLLSHSVRKVSLNFVLPETWVTLHSGDIGYTFGLLRETQDALAGV